MLRLKKNAQGEAFYHFSQTHSPSGPHPAAMHIIVFKERQFGRFLLHRDAMEKFEGITPPFGHGMQCLIEARRPRGNGNHLMPLAQESLDGHSVPGIKMTDTRMGRADKDAHQLYPAPPTRQIAAPVGCAGFFQQISLRHISSRSNLYTKKSAGQSRPCTEMGPFA